MGVGEQLSELGLTKMLPSLSTGGMLTVAMWVVGSLLVTGVICGIVVLVSMYLMYNQKVRLFKKVGNRTTPLGIFKARFVRIGQAGDKQLYVPKLKKYLPTPTIQTGKSEWWYYEREDHEWINFTLGDLDEDMKTAGAFYTDFDMRMARIGIEKNLRERLMKQNFWEKYGATIMNLMAFMIIIISLVIFFWMFNKLVGSIGSLVDGMDAYIKAYNNIVGQSTGAMQV